jgi:hypothetical protein
MSVLYRLFTERKNVNTILRFVGQEFGGFTFYETVGYWQGKKERSLCIEIAVDKVTADIPLKISGICRTICSYNDQNCVLVQVIDVENQLIGQSGGL